jgi:hypothetical protein
MQYSESLKEVVISINIFASRARRQEGKEEKEEKDV